MRKKLTAKEGGQRFEGIAARAAAIEAAALHRKANAEGQREA